MHEPLAPARDPVRRSGIFGGAFDPPHRGHLAVAHAATRSLALDELLWIPTGVPPFPKGRSLTAAYHRARLCELCCREDPRWSVDRFELERRDRSYTIDTLEHLESRARHEGHETQHFLLVGDDQLSALDRWHRIEEWIDRVKVVAYPRGDFDPESWSRSVRLPQHVVTKILEARLDLPRHPASSTAVRAAIRGGKAADEWLLPQVAHYLRVHGLYLHERSEGPAAPAATD